MSKRLFAIAGFVLLSLLAVAGIAGYLYYRSLKRTPQYSLALLIDAAKRDDQAEIDEIVDIDAVVDDFMPQITDKAVELYGRGMSPQAIQRVAKLAEPLMPAVKQRARAELPRVIRERTGRFASVPFFAIVIGADRYLDIAANGDLAVVNGTNSNHPLAMRMRRNGDRWQVIGVKDDKLATDIARTIGQEIISIATHGGKDTADKFGIGNMSDLLRQAEELVK